MKPEQNTLKIKPLPNNENFKNFKSQWYELISKYSSDAKVIESFLDEIVKAYSSPKRYYHNLYHLEYMFEVLTPFKHLLNDPGAVCFSIWFHDIVYNSSKNDNEELSAERASEVLIQLNVPDELIAKVKSMIMATKSHMSGDTIDFDTQLLLDADLAILGSDEETYKAYSKSVRKEYNQYPDLLYNPGRKKVLLKFLQSEYIYKTEEIRRLFEVQARKNLSFELNQL